MELKLWEVWQGSSGRCETLPAQSCEVKVTVCWVACCRKQVFAKASGVVGSLAVDVTATTLTGTFVISSSGVPTVSDTFVIVKQPGYVRPSSTYC